MFRRIHIVILAALVVGLCASNAQAATITVGTTADTSGSQCTLRDAITASNSNAATGACVAGSGPADVIDLKSLSGTITLGSALPNVATGGATDLQGPGAAALTVSGNNSFGVFYVSGTASMSGLTIANGSCGFGCGIRNDGTLALNNMTVNGNTASSTGGANAFPQAGGISNTGTMTVTLSRVTGNSAVATGASNQNAPGGGGILNNGGATLTIDRSTVSGNSATATAPAGATTNVNGGGIDNLGTLNLLRSTVTGNAASASASTTFNSATGGGIANSNSPNVHFTVDRSTISDNTATAIGSGASNTPSAGGFDVFGSVGSASITSSTIARNSASNSANVIITAPAIFKSTIVANPQGGGANCGGAGGTSQGFNITDGTGCGFTQASDRMSTNPMLAVGGLADNGGPTRTIALQEGSPAIDGGLSSAGETVDQRGGPRPYDVPGASNAAGGDGTDVGAFEVGDTTPPETTITAGPADGATIADPTPGFEFSSNESGGSFECRFDGGAFAPCTSPVSSPAALADGPHSFEVRAIDSVGNVDGSPASRAFTVAVATTKPPAGDTTPPETTLTKAPVKKITTRSGKAKVSLAFGSEAGATFECSLDGGAFTPCKSPATFSLKTGRHVIAVRAVDSAGNVDATPAQATVLVKRRKAKHHRK